jgi:hypothetical protein
MFRCMVRTRFRVMGPTRLEADRLIAQLAAIFNGILRDRNDGSTDDANSSAVAKLSSRPIWPRSPSVTSEAARS